MMTFPQFQQLVAELRHAQKEFFSTKSGDALDQSKRLEKHVDRELAKLKEGQREMFPAEETQG